MIEVIVTRLIPYQHSMVFIISIKNASNLTDDKEIWANDQKDGQTPELYP